MNKNTNNCKHEVVIPHFDLEASKGKSRKEIKQLWPRFGGICPTCQTHVILYHSFEHYIAGDY